MAEFNRKMQEYHDGSILGLRLYMLKYWISYQNRRFKESYWPAYKKSVKKNPLKILYEIIWLTIYWKCIPYHYFRYKLYKKDFGNNRLLNYLPETIFYYKILPVINKQFFILDDKNLFEEFLKGQNVKFPRTVLKIKRGTIFTDQEEIIYSEKQLYKLLNKNKYQVLFCKPSNCGSGGKGILFFRRINDYFFDKNNNLLDFRYISKLSIEDWIFQEGIENCEELRKIYKYSLNSFRVMTYFFPGKGAKVIYCILKLGNNYAFTDNAHTGGIYVRVNTSTGELDDLAYDENLNEYSAHPFTGYKFNGTIIPGITDVVKTAELLGTKIPNLSFIGWDIALSESGPIVLEGNSSPGLTIIQRTYEGMREFIEIVKKEEII